jgi:hypothetical protein
MGSKGGQTTTQTQTSKPWNIDALKNVGNAAVGMVKQDIGYKPFEDPTYTPFSGQTLQGLGQMEATATGGGGLGQPASSFLGSNINGDYLNSNPYLMQALAPGADAIKTRSDMSAAGAGRYGSGAAAKVTADSLSNYYSNALMQNYENERGRQMQSVGMAPAIDPMRYADAQRLMGVGSAYEGKSQQALDDAMQRWNAYEARPWEQLGRLNSILTGAGALGGTQTTQAPGASPIAGILGGGMAGGSILGGLGNAGMFGAGGALAGLGGPAALGLLGGGALLGGMM